MAEEDVVYVPTKARSGTHTLHIELRVLQGGTRALPAYTSIRELVAACGPQQSWVALDHQGMAEVQAETGCDSVLVNPARAVDFITQPRDRDDEIPGSHLPKSWLRDPGDPAARHR